jgi:hypothetical protein
LGVGLSTQPPFLFGEDVIQFYFKGENNMDKKLKDARLNFRVDEKEKV